MLIHDVMTQPVITCSIDDTADTAARLMWEHDCGMIPAVDADGRLAGVITDRDVCMAAYTQGRPLAEIGVASAVARQVAVCRGEDTVEAAEDLMRDTQVRRLPVVDDDMRPIGVVSMNDLARVALQTRKAPIDRELIQTLAAISRPRANGDLHPARSGAIA